MLFIFSSKILDKLAGIITPFGIYEDVNIRFKIHDSKFGPRIMENFSYKYKKHSGISS